MLTAPLANVVDCPLLRRRNYLTIQRPRRNSFFDDAEVCISSPCQGGPSMSRMSLTLTIDRQTRVGDAEHRAAVINAALEVRSKRSNDRDTPAERTGCVGGGYRGESAEHREAQHEALAVPDYRD